MSTDGFIFSQDGKTLVKCEFSKLGTVINVPQGVTKIGNGVFAEAPVTKVILPDSVTEIGQNLFSSCESIEDVKLSSNLESLKPFTFAGCSSLRKITMPDNIVDFPEGLFWGCMSLQDIPFRTGSEVLATDVCRDCESITSVLIPPSVKTIKTGALAGCTNLSTIVFPAGLEKIEDRSLSGLKSLQYMRFSENCKNFFVDENSGALYQLTENGAILIKCPVNVESVYLVQNTCDVHVDAFECCSLLKEVYAFEEAPEALINKLLELVPAIDINSYNNEPTEEESFSEKIKDLSQNLDQVKVDDTEFSQIGEFTQDDNYDEQETAQTFSDDTLPSQNIQQEIKAELSQTIAEDINVNNVEQEQNIDDAKIQEILNSQCCRNESLDEGFRPITMDELDKLFSNSVEIPVVENTVTNSEAEETVSVTEEKPKRGRSSRKKKSSDATDSSVEKPKRRRTKKTQATENSQIAENSVTLETAQNSTDDSATEQKPKRKRATRKSKTKTEYKTITAVEPELPASTEDCEPRFIRAMKQLASHQMIVEEEDNKLDNVYGDLKELFVIADGVAPSTNDFSSHLVKFSKDIAKKYGFTKIYFFEDLPLDNPEFIYGLESFGNFRNILYACNKQSEENISDNQKGLINAAGISLPPSARIKSVKEKLSTVELKYPVKIVVQDNYIEGLLYCAEKYRKDHDIK